MGNQPIPAFYGEMVFDDRKMKEYLAEDVYQSLHRSITEGSSLDTEVLESVADAMKKWALEKGATHFTHWFQPLTGITAEKHDSFVDPVQGGGVLMKFSAKELMRGEPDASSFPSGGLRATFEARGYTVWDASSYAFVKGRTLYIPTAFCSYTGEALDLKTPLLRSMESLNREAIRVLRLFGNDTAQRVSPSVGAEQEYFLIDKEAFYKRRDMVYTGRTLFGSRSPKGQEMDDHYFGVLKPRVAAFMENLNDELWKLGIAAKTQHNEVAPGQHELACVYATANIATDNNQLVMEMMQKIASQHNMVCLLHEKPFAGVNGSGKHNNWSLATDTGINLLSPGDTPSDNAQFLLFLVAIVKAVDEYQDLLRISVATASNDHRLGASEAPPAVVSIFLGDELTAILEALAAHEDYKGAEKSTLKLGVDLLPKLPRDTTDRNRTSPFAFTGNKFEFRMVGSSSSIAEANIMLNTAVADVLRGFADELEKAEDFEGALHHLIRRTFRDHKRIIFNGNGYDDAWIKEATEERGLSNYPTTPDALKHLTDEKNLELFRRMGVFSDVEVKSRMDIKIENYCKIVEIEARTVLKMLWKDILPAISAYQSKLLEGAARKKEFKLFEVNSYEYQVASDLNVILARLKKDSKALGTAMEEVGEINDMAVRATVIRDGILPLMDSVRKYADEAEQLVERDYWPFPTYGDLFNSVH